MDFRLNTKNKRHLLETDGAFEQYSFDPFFISFKKGN